jgi:hypothetical protein
MRLCGGRVQGYRRHGVQQGGARVREASVKSRWGRFMLSASPSDVPAGEVCYEGQRCF